MLINRIYGIEIREDEEGEEMKVGGRFVGVVDGIMNVMMNKWMNE